MKNDFYTQVEAIVEKDPRYRTDAYEFILQGLMFTQKKLKRSGHVTGRELAEGLRDFGIAQYGPMVRVVFAHWGIKSTEDFGNIVFTMIRHKLLGRTEQDSLDDFKNVYDFDSAFDVFQVKK